MTHAMIYRIIKESHILIARRNITLFILANGRVGTRPQAVTVLPARRKPSSINTLR